MAVELDGVRGFAALVVSLFHYWKLFAEHDQVIFTSWFSGMFNGVFSVAIFFVLSGRVLMGSAYKLSRTEQSTKSLAPLLGSALVRRICRLFYPALAISFLIWILSRTPLLTASYARLDHLLDNYDFGDEPRGYGHIGQKHQKVGVFELYSEMTRLIFRTPWTFYTPLIAPTWTLHHEMVGSLLLYAVTPFVLTYPRFGLVALVWTVWTSSTLEKDDHVWFECFLGGLTLCHLHYTGATEFLMRRKPSRPSLATAVTVLRYSVLSFLCLFILVVWTTVNREAPIEHPWLDTVKGLPILSSYEVTFAETWAAIALIFVVENLRPVQFIFASRPLAYLGKISFSLYLVHGFVYTLVSTWFLPVLLPPIPSDPDADPISISVYRRAIWRINLPVALLVVIPIAHVLTHLVDRPSITLGRYVIAKLNTTESTATGVLVEVLVDVREQWRSMKAKVVSATARQPVQDLEKSEYKYESLPTHGSP